MKLLAWFARNGVAANLLMVLIVFSGLVSSGSIRKEVFPEISADMISVSVAYLGAAPEEVEEAVCARIEERVEDLDVVQTVTSTAAEGVGTVTIGLVAGADTRKALDDVKARVDAIDTFPEETEKPVIKEVVLRQKVISIAISGSTDERSLKALAENVRDELLARGTITQVEVAAARPYEVSIEVSEESLRRRGLSFEQVAAAVRRSSLDLPGGSIRTDAGEILLRTKGQAYRRRDFEDLVLLTRPDGSRLTLGEVATVVDGFADTGQAARFDGEPAVLVDVYRVGEQDVITVADEAKAYLAEARAALPEGIEMTLWQDDTRLFRSRLETLLKNGAAGFLLVLLVLALFLRLRLAFWVASGIVVSFAGALWLMPSLDLSINQISLFAFIVVLGIVVDDAIVIGENVYRHYQMGKERLEAAVDGAKEVAVPVLFSVLTTIAAFAPMTLVPGNTGKVMKVIPMIVVATLFFSLVEALFVLPSHLSHLRHGTTRRGPWRRLQDQVGELLERLISRAYRPTLTWALEWRYTTLAIGLGLLLLSVGWVAGKRIHFSFFPKIEGDNVVAFLTLPQGTPADVTAETLRQIESSAETLRREIADDGEPGAFRHLMTSIGEQPFRARGHRTSFAEPTAAPHLGEVNIELAPGEERRISAAEVVRRWRELTGPVPGAEELTFQSSLFSTGDPINVQLAGPRLDELEQAAAELEAALADYPAVFDVTDSFRLGKREVRLDVTPQAESLGLRRAELARQVRQAFYGEEAQRIQRGRDEVKVMVRYPESERRSLANLEDMRIRTPDGDAVPFAVAADVRLGRGFATIQRTDGKRTVNVTADVDLREGNANEILADVERSALPAILANHHGLSYTLEGEQKQQRETMGGLRRGFLIALFLIYALLAIPFRSYVQPLIVMTAIPFGVIGAMWGHVLMGLDLVIMSMFGIVALSGVVVNDSLILVDFINRELGEGIPLADAIRKAGEARFRPILLTSLTTFAGLTPLLLERSLQAQFLIPMATSLAFGVLFATAITLVLVPVIYAILEDVKIALARTWSWLRSFWRAPDSEPIGESR